MMEIDLQGWLTSVLASWGLVSVADALTHGVMLALLVAAAFLADAVCRCFLLKAVAHLVKRTKATWDDVVFDHKVMVRLSRIDRKSTRLNSSHVALSRMPSSA